MAYAPIALVLPQYDDLSLANWWLKAYEQGTTTPLAMATDATGGTTAAKFQVDSEGFFITAGNARLIPFIDGQYDLWLFPTAAEADANDTTNAIQFADNLNSDPSAGRPTTASKDSRYGPVFATVSAMTAASPVAVDGVQVDLVPGMSVSFQGYALSSDPGGAEGIIKTAAQAATDGDVIDELGAGFTLDNGNVWVKKGNVHWLAQFGALGAAGDVTANINAWAAIPGVRRASRSKTYQFSTQLSIPANADIKTGGCTFELIASIAGNVAAVLVAEGSSIDVLNVSIATTFTVDRPVNIADSCSIGEINVTSVDQINNRTDTLDGAVYISGDDITIGHIKTTNYDNGAVVYQSDRANIGSMLFISYVRGALLREVDGSFFGSVKTTTASANATQDPGHNGLLIEQVTNSEFPAIGVQNSGEHAVRIGSGVTGPSKNLAFGIISAWKPGQCGFKVNDDSFTTQYIIVGEVLVTDCATGSATGTNEDPVRLEKAKDITIGSISGNIQDKANCGNDGVFINACERVKLGLIELENPLNTGVNMVDTDGQFKDIEIDNLKLNACAGNGIEITSNTQNLENVVVHDGYIRDISGAAGVLITTNDPVGSNGVPNPVIVDFKFHSGTGVAFSTTSTAGRLYDRTETFA
jgi:hypothetical protein